MSMKECSETLLTWLLCGAFLIGWLSWQVYKYDDCKKVGHTTVYCIFAPRG